MPSKKLSRSLVHLFEEQAADDDDSKERDNDDSDDENSGDRDAIVSDDHVSGDEEFNHAAFDAEHAGYFDDGPEEERVGATPKRHRKHAAVEFDLTEVGAKLAVTFNNLNTPQTKTSIILIRTRRLCRSRELNLMLTMMMGFDPELIISGVVGLLYHIHQKILLLRLIRLINGRQTTDAELSGRYP